MKIFKWLTDTFQAISSHDVMTRHEPSHDPNQNDHINAINPASSQPMTGFVDIHGNPYGTNSSISHDVHNPIHDHYNHHDSFNHHSGFDHHHYHDPFRNY